MQEQPEKGLDKLTLQLTIVSQDSTVITTLMVAGLASFNGLIVGITPP